jgi:adenylate cyclase
MGTTPAAVPTSPPESVSSPSRRGSVPLVGFASLLLRQQLDPDLSNHRLHFVLFLAVGAGLFVLAYAAGDAANRRGDARVLLISLAFLATGAFLGVHALGTEGVLFQREYAGFKVAIPVGLLLAAVFAGGSAFVDARPELAPAVVRHRATLRRAVLAAMTLWFVWTVAEIPPLNQPTAEGGSHSMLAMLAIAGTVVYGVAAVRYWYVYRGRLHLLPASIVACFVLLAEAMIGVAITGERDCTPAGGSGTD